MPPFWPAASARACPRPLSESGGDRRAGSADGGRALGYVLSLRPVELLLSAGFAELLPGCLEG